MNRMFGYGRWLALLLVAVGLALVWAAIGPEGADRAVAGSSCYQQCSADYGQCLASTGGNQSVCTARRKACLARCAP
jgi:hypothetical protein